MLAGSELGVDKLDGASFRHCSEGCGWSMNLTVI